MCLLCQILTFSRNFPHGAWPPAADLRQNVRSDRSSHRWAVNGQCPRGSWWCTLQNTGCCRSYCRPQAHPSRCASPPPGGSALTRHPDASPCARRCRHPGQRTGGSAEGWPPSQSLPGTTEQGRKEKVTRTENRRLVTWPFFTFFTF